MLNSYHSLLVLGLTLGFYCFSFGLVKYKKISLLNHRKFWNYVLLVSFLISGVLGLLLAICIDQKFSISWYREVLWLHVESGIVMAIISIFHAFWHVKYYLSGIKKISI